MPLPLLYNGDPDFLHTITITYTNTGNPTLTTTRLVKAQTVASVPDNILSPPEFDVNGNAFQVVLPDVQNPTAAQRSYPIVVQTDSTAQSVAINFTSGPAVNPSDIVSTARRPMEIASIGPSPGTTFSRAPITLRHP